MISAVTSICCLLAALLTLLLAPVEVWPVALGAICVASFFGLLALATAVRTADITYPRRWAIGLLGLPGAVAFVLVVLYVLLVVLPEAGND